MNRLFQTYLSLSTDLPTKIAAELSHIVHEIGFTHNDWSPILAQDSQQWQRAFDQLQRADLFIGVYGDTATYTRGGLWYSDAVGANYAISKPMPQQTLELSWAIKLKLPLLLWTTSPVGPAGNPEWDMMYQQGRGYRHTRTLSPAGSLHDQVTGYILTEWTILMLKACWRNWNHPELPPRPMLT